MIPEGSRYSSVNINKSCVLYITQDKNTITPVIKNEIVIAIPKFHFGGTFTNSMSKNPINAYDTKISPYQIKIACKRPMMSNPVILLENRRFGALVLSFARSKKI